MYLAFRLIAQRAVLGLLTLLFVSLMIFSSVALLPGDFAESTLGQTATRETVEAFRHELGLDMPAHERYIAWMRGVLVGDFGTSLANNRPVGELIASRIWNTVFLASYAAAIAVPLALGGGILAALYRDSWVDRSVSIGALTVIGSPEFFMGYLLVYIFSVNLGWFPSMAMLSVQPGIGERLYALFLPAITLTAATAAYMMRMTRAAIIDVLGSDYVEMAILKGMPAMRVVVWHALPNALAPIANVIAINLAYLITGVVVVEVVFAYPGIGQLLVNSVAKRDIPVVQAISLVLAVTYVFFNLTADLVGIFSNSRLRHPR